MMPDREKVIKGLEMCIKDIECTGCPYENDCFAPDDNPFGTSMMRDALALLKEQEPKTVNDYESGGVYRFVGLKRGTCPSCSHEVIGGNSTKFCWNCGQAVKWNDD